MNAKSDLASKELYRAVDEVLYYVWDPIGVSGMPQARDEYRYYLKQVIELIKGGSTQKQIADCLAHIKSTSMGLPENSVHDFYVAELLLSWRECINEKNCLTTRIWTLPASGD